MAITIWCKGKTQPIVFKTYTAQAVYSCICELLQDSELSEEDIHLEVANADSWCELACVGETYESDDFCIEIT